MPMALTDRAQKRLNKRNAKRWEDLQNRLTAIPEKISADFCSTDGLERKFCASINARYFRCAEPAQTAEVALLRLAQIFLTHQSALEPLMAMAFLLQHAPAVWRVYRLSPDDTVTPSPKQFGTALERTLDALAQLHVDLRALAQRQSLGELGGDDFAAFYTREAAWIYDSPAVCKVAARWLPADAPPGVRQAVQKMRPADFRLHK